MGVLMVLATMVNAWKPFTFSYVLNMGDLGVFNLGFTHLILVVAAIGVVMMFAVWNRNAPYLALLASLIYLPLVQTGSVYPIYHIAAVAAVGALWRIAWYIRWPGDATVDTPTPKWKSEGVQIPSASELQASQRRSGVHNTAFDQYLANGFWIDGDHHSSDVYNITSPHQDDIHDDSFDIGDDRIGI